jgi:N4-(beta-N-acetylglucosaminyl)-L-asparaginase
MQRRQFLWKSLLASGSLVLLRNTNAIALPKIASASTTPFVMSTWAPNVKANEAAWQILKAGGRALDAVEAGVKVPEADPNDVSVGYGGLPDRDGKVTLDACIMDDLGNCGSVMCIENIMHPIAVARLVMEKTPHVILVGDGALQFALENGFKKENLLTESSELRWKEWLKSSNYNPKDPSKFLKEVHNAAGLGGQGNHDTIGMIARDVNGNLSGACSTSGMAYKIHGRVGDSPVFGAGLFVDNEIGAATATGVGEEVLRICGSHTIVEAMRYGKTPQEACKIGVERMYNLRKGKIEDKQIGFIAINKAGEMGAYSLKSGFTYAFKNPDGTDVVKEAIYMIE